MITPNSEGTWFQSAACLGVETELFFPNRGESVAEAKAVCAACAARIACADYALKSGQRHGIWGGLTERERRRLRSQRRSNSTGEEPAA